MRPAAGHPVVGLSRQRTFGYPRRTGDIQVDGVIAPEVRRPVELRRGWKVLAVGTPSGRMHLAAGDTALELLREEFPG